MRMLLSVLVLSFLVSSSIAGAYEINTLSDGNTSKNFTFSSAGSQLFNISVYKYANVSSANLNITGYASSPQIQNEGNSSLSGSWLTGGGSNPANLNDSNDNTYAVANGCPATANFSVNYTKPANIGYVTSLTYHIAVGSSGYCDFTGNISINGSCLSQSVIQMRFDSINPAGCGSGSQLVSCWNGTAWYPLRSCTAGMGNAAYIREESMYWNYYPGNITIDSGVDGTSDYINRTIFNSTEKIDINKTAVNKYLNCQSSNDYCTVPFNLTSNYTGILQVSNINITYSEFPALTNCSEGGGSQTLSLSHQEETNQTSMSGTLDVTFDLLSYHGNQSRNYSLRFASNTTHAVCLYPSWASYSVDAIMQYGSTDFPSRGYFLVGAPLSNSSQSIILYSLATALGSNINVQVKNAFGSAEKDVVVRVHRYYVGEGLYKTIAMIKSDYLGESTTFLRTNDVFYKYVLLKNGAVVRTIGPALLTSVDLLLSTSPTDVLTYLDRLENITGTCTFQEATSYVVCPVDVATGIPKTFSLDVDKLGVLNTSHFNETFVYSASTTIMVNASYLVQQNKSIRYILSVFSDDNLTKDILYTGYYNATAGSPYGETGLLVTGLTIMTFSLLGAWNPVVSVALCLVAIGMSVPLGWFDVTLGGLGSLFFVGVIIIVRLKT